MPKFQFVIVDRSRIGEREAVLRTYSEHHFVGLTVNLSCSEKKLSASEPDSSIGVLANLIHPSESVQAGGIRAQPWPDLGVPSWVCT